MRPLDNKQTLKSIENALVEARSQVPLTATWRDLHTGYGIGSIKGKQLRLSPEDRTSLRELVKARCNIDLLAGAGKGLSQISNLDRMTLSGMMANEKFSGVPVAEEAVLVGSPTGQLTLAGGTVQLPTGMLVSCHYTQLHGLPRVVQVENLAPMYALDQYQWPEETGTAVMLFRGSPQHSPAAVRKALAEVDEVICFPDYDPQGLRNSFTENSRLAGVILPSRSTIETLMAANLNQPEKFAKQENARRWLEAHRSDNESVDFVLSRRVALSQEAMTGCALEFQTTSGPTNIEPRQ